MTEDAVPVAQQIRGAPVSRACLPELMRGPFSSRMRRDREMHDPPTLVSEHQKHIQHLKPNRRHGKEVHGHQTADVIVQECPPRLGRGLRWRTKYLLTLEWLKPPRQDL